MPDIGGELGTGSAGTPVPDRAVPLSGWFSKSRFAALSGSLSTSWVGSVGYVPEEGTDWLYVDLADRLIDWSDAGVWYNAFDPTRPWEGTRGIPVFPVGVTMQSVDPGGAYYINPAVGVDNRAAIQAALDACATSRAVLLPAGHFYFTPPLYTRSFKVLRGSGPGVTTITSMTTGTTRSIVFMSSGMGNIGTADVGPDAGNTGGPLSSGYTKGSYTVVVTDAAVAATMAVGETVLINETNDPSFVDNVGYGGTCTWAAGGGARALGEVKMIASISGTSITFTQPLFYTYSAIYLPKIVRLNSPTPLLNAGIEDMTLDGDMDGGYGGGYFLSFQNCAHCWGKGLEVKDWGAQFIRFENACFGNEIRRCFFHDTTNFTGGLGYAMGFLYSATSNLIEDNAFKWIHVCTAIGAGGATANVIGYNYCHNLNHWQPTWAMSAWGCHGAHTYMNLEEGNQGPRHLADAYWGSGSHLMIFRNWASLEVNNPSVINNQIAIEIEGNYPPGDPSHHVSNRWHSAIGNVLGHSGMATSYYECDTAHPDHSTGEFFMWKIGYRPPGVDPVMVDPQVRATLVQHGNYDYFNNSVADWMPGVSHTIPNSLYLASKPSWFGSLDWPPYGPDVAGFHKTIPAKHRWDNYQISGVLADMFADET
jgi:hypothetical protein